jgi:hypothetical protein
MLFSPSDWVVGFTNIGILAIFQYIDTVVVIFQDPVIKIFVRVLI